MTKGKCVIKEMKGGCLHCSGCFIPKACNDIREAYEKGVQNGISVRGVGHWIIGKTSVTGLKTSTCSHCGKESQGKIGGEIKHIFMGDALACPMCGAYMTGRDDEKEYGKE